MSANEETREAYQPTRRGFLAGMVAGSALLAIGPSAFLGTDSAIGATRKPGTFLPEFAASERDVFRYFQPGTGVVHDWFISETTFESGAIVLVLSEKDGAEVRVDICKNAGNAAGVDSTSHFDLLVMNDGGGAKQTETDAHQAVRILAEVLRRTEIDLTAAPAPMKSHAERLAMIESEALRFPIRA